MWKFTSGEYKISWAFDNFYLTLSLARLRRQPEQERNFAESNAFITKEVTLFMQEWIIKYFIKIPVFILSSQQLIVSHYEIRM